MPTLVTWPDRIHTEVPTTYPAEGFSGAGVEALFFENEIYRGKPTRVFAWMGMPYLREGETCPAMVLLHGGGGTAFDEWVRLWNQRGYAAIAIDQCGSVPEQPKPIFGGVEHARHNHSGPAGWNASFEAVNEPIEEQWQYHAVAAILRAHTLLASQPGVDADRIGLTGISWGGYMTSLISGVDSRYKCSIPVYGCGHLEQDSIWQLDNFPALPQADVSRWLELWDPSQYLPNAGM
ncbi:MAG: alpha/beta hydrolase family protein, partial [Planctomycetota bacterium]